MARNYLNGLDYMGDIGRRKHGHHAHGGHAHAPLSHRMQAAYSRAQGVAQFAVPDIPGAPARDGALLPAGFPVFGFVLATGVNIINGQMNVQTPFRGQRLTALVIRNGTSAATTAPVIQTFLVGQKPIIASASAVPLEIFAQNAYDTNLVLPPTYPGVIYSLNLSLTNALTTTDTLTALVGILGSALL
jgi:hypothetical protein